MLITNTFFPRESRGIVLMIVSVFLFTATALLLSFIHKSFGIDGWTASAYRAAIGLIMVYLMQKQTGKLSVRRVFTQPLLFTRGLVGGLTIPVYYITIMELGPGRAGIIAGAYPLFAATFALYFLGEPVSRRYYGYIAIALIGLAGIFSNDGFGTAKPLFDSIALGGAAAAGICVVLIRHLRHTETTSNIFAAQCIFALILGVGGAGKAIFIHDPVALAFVLVASILVAVAQLSLTAAFRHINVAKGSTLQMLTPACTAIGSAFLLNEVFSGLEILGGCAILFAGYRIVVEKTQKIPKNQKNALS